jgi:hypothetical protein
MKQRKLKVSSVIFMTQYFSGKETSIYFSVQTKKTAEVKNPAAVRKL